MTFTLLSGQSENIAAFEEVVRSGATTPLHIYRESDEAIHVLPGELMISQRPDVVLQQARVAAALQDLAQCPPVHVDPAVADPIEVPLRLEAFDRLARDGRQQNVAEAVLHDRQALLVERDAALAVFAFSASSRRRRHRLAARQLKCMERGLG